MNCWKAKCNMEIWKDVVGFETNYEVSNMGRVRSKTRTIMRSNGYPLNLCGKILPQYPKYGNSDVPRWFVNLSQDGKPYTKTVHRLVATAFIPNPNNLPQINHKGEDPSNNRVENLEWCDCDYNHNYGTRNSRHAEKLKKPVDVYDLDGNFLSHHNSVKSAAEEYNCDESSITKVCKGKIKFHHNLLFKYS